MKFIVVAAIFVLGGACTKSPESRVQSSAPATELGLNDVAIILPYKTLPELMQKAPTAFDRPDPARFAPGMDALPGDGESFVPTSLLKEISALLVDDDAIHKREGFAFGNIGDANFEADITIPGGEQGPSPYRFVSMRIDAC